MNFFKKMRFARSNASAWNVIAVFVGVMLFTAFLTGCAEKDPAQTFIEADRITIEADEAPLKIGMDDIQANIRAHVFEGDDELIYPECYWETSSDEVATVQGNPKGSPDTDNPPEPGNGAVVSAVAIGMTTITAQVDQNKPDPSASIDVYITPGTPNPPAITASVTTGELEVVWDEVEATTVTLTYVLYRTVDPDSGAYTQVAAVEGLEYTDTGLTDGTAYYYALAIKDNQGNEGPMSDPAGPFVPGYPGMMLSTTAIQGDALVDAITNWYSFTISNPGFNPLDVAITSDADWLSVDMDAVTVGVDGEEIVTLLVDAQELTVGEVYTAQLLLENNIPALNIRQTATIDVEITVVNHEEVMAGLGADGGMVVTPTGMAAVNIPANAIMDTTDVTIITNHDYDHPMGALFYPYHFSATEIALADTAMATVTLAYPAYKVAEGDTTVAAAWYDTEAEAWVHIEEVQLDMETHTVAFDVMQLGTFVVIRPEE